MARAMINALNISGAKLKFKNFSGKESKFNKSGARNFCVDLDPEDAQKLLAEGWNVRITPATDEFPESCYLQVSVNFDGDFPPKILMINSTGKHLLNRDNVDQLDYADIAGADLVIRPYCWEVNGKTGVKAYLKAMYVTIEEDVFAQKYASLEGPDEDTVPFN